MLIFRTLFSLRMRFGEGMPEEDIAVTLPGGAKLEMVWIQPGRFMMGSPTTEPERDDDEGPQHEVTITKGFYLGKYEVTQAQWESVMNTRPWAGSGASGDPEKANFPAFFVRWEDVETFLRRLNETEGKDIYRLPTEAEWEYACRAGTTTPWSFGDDLIRVGDYARYLKTHEQRPYRKMGVLSTEVRRRRKQGRISEPLGPIRYARERAGMGSGFLRPVYRKTAQTDPTGPEARLSKEDNLKTTMLYEAALTTTGHPAVAVGGTSSQRNEHSHRIPSVARSSIDFVSPCLAIRIRTRPVGFGPGE